MSSINSSLALNFASLCLCRKVDGPRAPRDERRRAQHNEGEFCMIFTSGRVLSAIFDIVGGVFLQWREEEETKSTTGS